MPLFQTQGSVMRAGIAAAVVSIIAVAGVVGSYLKQTPTGVSTSRDIYCWKTSSGSGLCINETGGLRGSGSAVMNGVTLGSGLAWSDIQPISDNRYVNTSGDTMTGSLNINSANVTASGARIDGTVTANTLNVSGDSSGSGNTAIEGDIAVGGTTKLNNITYTWPPLDGSASGKTLKTDSAGQLSWSDDTGGGTSYISKTTNYTAAASDLVLLSSTGGIANVYLAASPTTEDEVGVIMDYTVTRTDTHAADFESGSSQYASIADGVQSGLDITGDMTIEFWYQFESHVAAHTFVQKYLSAGDQRSYSVAWNGTDLSISLAPDGINGTTKTTTWTPTDATWYHIAVVYTASAGTAQFYINGIEQGSLLTALPTSIHSGSADVYVGTNNAAGGYADGILDDLRIWTVARTKDELINNRHKTLAGTESGLVAYWRFDNAWTSTPSNTLTPAGAAPTFVTTVPTPKAIIYGNGKNINGAGFKEIGTKYDYYGLKYNGTEWNILSLLP